MLMPTDSDSRNSIKALLLILPLLTACGDLSYSEEVYAGLPIESVTVDGRTWLIQNDAPNFRMSVVQGPEQAMLDRMTFDLTKQPAPRFMEAAQTYLDQRNLRCRAVGAAPILLSYEITYICQP